MKTSCFAMNLLKIVLFILFCIYAREYACEDVTTSKWPTIFIAILARNKAHILPYFFSALNNMDYPKDRIMIWLQSDHNEDNTTKVILHWQDEYSRYYHNVNVTILTSSALHDDETSCSHWSAKRFKHVIELRETAFQLARYHWADFMFMLDADVLLSNTKVLRNLVAKKFPIVSPMLSSDGLYSNFCMHLGKCGMTEDYYYHRTDDYKPIVTREKVGCFKVPMIHSAVLINLRSVESERLTYVPQKLKNYNGPEDDIIAFAISAKQTGLPLHVCNDHQYGFVTVPLEDDSELKGDHEQLLNVKLEAISRGVFIPLDDKFYKFAPKPDRGKYGFNEIYLINLARRIERKTFMEKSFEELGMDVKHFVAVDGRKLDLNDLHRSSITLMPGYEDPYYKRPMKAGEVGCFLSHYKIWEEVVTLGHDTALILEDDIHFVPYFRHKLLNLLKEINQLEWDLVYIGRKILMSDEEVYVTSHVVKPLYSYWTLGYLISNKGARKLINARPLTRLLPVDEFLPIMFDQHPNDTWKSYFPVRNLAAYSASPLLVHPTHYTGQPGYISDTEDSDVFHKDASVTVHTTILSDEL